jgi:hypothetical protein
MEQQQGIPDKAAGRVMWWHVIAGILVAIVVGVGAGAGGGLLGMALSPTVNGRMQHTTVLMVGGGMTAVALTLGLIWRLSRASAPSFAKGIIVGGCITVLTTGFCNTMIGMLASSN